MNLHKLIKPLSIGIVSLGLLAGIGIVSNNTNIHAMTADQLLHDPYVDEKVQKDTEANEAYWAKQAEEATPIVEEQDKENTVRDDTPSQQPMPVGGNYNIKPAKHVRRHNKNAVHNHRARRASRRTRRNKRARYTRRTRQNRRKRNNHRDKLTKKQYRSINKKIRNVKRALKSRHAKHFKRYAKALKRQIKKIQKQLKA